MIDLAARLGGLPAARGRAPWPNHEYVRGWGVFGLPFDSGHVLALRVFPDNDFAPYRTVWHRDPAGAWSIYVHGPQIETACPRYYGPACVRTAFARIDLAWTGPATLHVTVDEPHLEWDLVATETAALRALNAVGPRLPPWTWRAGALVRARELLAEHVLHLGAIRLAGTMPSGHTGLLMPECMYFIDASTAVLAGQDLGRPATVTPNPRIGEVPLPARGVLAIGQAAWPIRDPAENARRRAETADAVS
jgi:hypothetical protein